MINQDMRVWAGISACVVALAPSLAVGQMESSAEALTQMQEAPAPLVISNETIAKARVVDPLSVRDATADATAAAPAALPTAAAAEDTRYYTVAVTKPGPYRLAVPGGSDVRIALNGDTLLDLDPGQTAGQEDVTAIAVLQPGLHIFELAGSNLDAVLQGGMVFNRTGGTPIPFNQIARPVTQTEANDVIAARKGPGAVTPGQPGAQASRALGTQGEGFAIGGGQSKARRTGAVQPNGTGGAGAGALGGSQQMAALSPRARGASSGGSSGGGVVSGGAVSIPTISGGSSSDTPSNTGATGTTGSSGTPTASIGGSFSTGGGAGGGGTAGGGTVAPGGGATGGGAGIPVAAPPAPTPTPTPTPTPAPAPAPPPAPTPPPGGGRGVGAPR